MRRDRERPREYPIDVKERENTCKKNEKKKEDIKEREGNIRERGIQKGKMKGKYGKEADEFVE